MSEVASRRVQITRLINAPVALVWAAWTDPAQVRQWWGPNGFTTPECELDVRVGGRLFMVMKGPEGPGFPMDGTYLEIVPHEKLVFTNRPLGPDGQPLAEGHTTITLRDVGGRTELSIDSTSTTDFKAMLEGMDIGWGQQTDRMVAFMER